MAAAGMTINGKKKSSTSSVEYMNAKMTHWLYGGCWNDTSAKKTLRCWEKYEESFVFLQNGLKMQGWWWPSIIWSFTSGESETWPPSSDLGSRIAVVVAHQRQDRSSCNTPKKFEQRNNRMKLVTDRIKGKWRSMCSSSMQ